MDTLATTLQHSVTDNGYNATANLKLAKFSTMFKKRTGATDVGKDYEHFYIANLILKLVLDSKVEDFYLSSNDEEFGSFDDVVVGVKNVGEVETVVYAVQLKHSNNKILRVNDLTSPKGNYSLNKYYSENALASKVQMVLFTNSTAEKFEFIQVTLKDEIVNVELVKNEQSELLKTSEQGVCYQFLSDKCSELFQNFTLYANQANVVALKMQTLDLFREKFGGDEDVFKKFLDFITQWSLKEGKKCKLDKIWMKEQLFVLLSSPFVKPMPFSTNAMTGGKRRIFRDGITKFETLRFDAQTYEIVKHLWQDVVKDSNLLHQINQAQKKYLLSLRRIQTEEDLNGEDKEMNQFLWLLGKSLLILEGCPQVYKAIKVCTAKDIIILDDSEDLEMTAKFRNLSNLKSYRDIYEELLNNFTYSIEGQKETPLKDLLEMKEELEEEITLDKLAKMVEGPLQIGSQKEKLPPCHIERKLTKIVIDFQFVKNLPKNTIVLISHVEDINWLREEIANTRTIQMEQTSEDDNVVYISSIDISDKEFSNVSSKNPMKCIHLFRFLNKSSLEWITSKNSSDNNDYFEELNKFRLENEQTSDVLHESEMFGERENNINIICANPGMGKSTIAKSLKNNSSSKMWTLVIYARNYGQHFRKFGANVDEFIKHVLIEQIKHENEEKNFNIFLMVNRVRLIWDGLDEVSEQTFNKILSLIEAISSRGIKQWLTSRNNLKEQLERRFKTFARDLNQFNEEEQKDYIRNRLKVPDAEMHEIFPKIKSNIEMYSNNDILGVPLQIFMLTELLSQDKTKYLQLLNDFFTILDLYEHFVHEQFKLFYEGKRNQNLNNDRNLDFFENEKKNQIKCYQEIAFQVHLKGWWAKTLSKWLSYNSQFNTHDEVGLIKQATNIDDVEFMHNSYGEYFAALYLFENNRPKTRDISFISNEKFNNIRFFLDLMLARNSKPVAAVLCRNYTLFEKCSKEDLKSRDLIGRDLLELSCAWNKHLPILHLQDDAHVEFKLNERNATVLDYNSIKTKIDKIDFSNDLSKKHLLLFFPFLIPFYDEKHQDFDPVYLQNILTYAVKLDNTLLFDLVQNSLALKSSFVNTIKRESLLSSALNWKSRKVLDKLLSDEEYLVLLLRKLGDLLRGLSQQHEEMFKYLIHLKDLDEKMPIHHACANGDFESVRWLIDKGSKLSVLDRFNQLPIQYASQIGSFEIVKLLLSQTPEVNIPDNNGFRLIHYACRHQFDGELLKLLLEKNARVDVPDARGTMPMHYACKNENGYQTVKVLLENETGTDVPDSNGVFPIHYACENTFGYKIVKLLLEHGAATQIPDSNGLLPMHYACQNKSDDSHQTVRLLLEKGAEIDAPDLKNILPMHYACQNPWKGYEIAKLLLEKGARVDSPDSNHVLPIHYACQNPEGYKIVKLLLENGARIDVPDPNGLLPIHNACQLNSAFEIVKLLLKYNARVDVPDSNGVLPMLYACHKSDLPTMKLLLENGAKMDVPDTKGVLPIHRACQNPYGYEIVKVLLENGMRIDVPDSDGIFPVFYACKDADVQTVKLLLENGARTDVPDSNGVLPMHYACQTGWYGYEKVKLLLETGAEIDVPDTNGILPVHYACKNEVWNGCETVKLLLEKGARVNIPDSNGVLPIHYASQNTINGYEVVKLLLENGAQIDVPDSKGILPVDYARDCAGCFQIVELLLENGAI